MPQVPQKGVFLGLEDRARPSFRGRQMRAGLRLKGFRVEFVFPLRLLSSQKDSGEGKGGKGVGREILQNKLPTAQRNKAAGSGSNDRADPIIGAVLWIQIAWDVLLGLDSGVALRVEMSC